MILFISWVSNEKGGEIEIARLQRLNKLFIIPTSLSTEQGKSLSLPYLWLPLHIKYFCLTLCCQGCTLTLKVLEQTSWLPQTRGNWVFLFSLAIDIQLLGADCFENIDPTDILYRIRAIFIKKKTNITPKYQEPSMTCKIPFLDIGE